MKKQNNKHFLLRVVAGTIMAVVISVLLVLSAFLMGRLHNAEGLKAQNGLITIDAETLVHKPVMLNGGWDSFNGVVCHNAEEVQTLGQQGGRTKFPIGSLSQAQKNATYRIYLQLPQEPAEKLFLAIPTHRGPINVYVNGVAQNLVPHEQQWISSHALNTVYEINDLKPGQQLQELVISGQFAQAPITLYKRPVLLGTMQNISTMVTLDSSAQMLMLGMLLLVLINGYVFMLFRPGHTLITVLTVFDSLLMSRIFPTMNYTLSIYQSIFPGLVFSDRFGRSVELFFMMLAGFAGCILAQKLFDPKKIAPWWLIKPPALCYLVLAVVFPLWPQFFEEYGRFLLVPIYFYTFVGVFTQFAMRWKRTKQRGYFLFQFLKTAYLGSVVLLDILFWTTYTDITIWLYLYLIFFFMHVIARLYDNNRSYEDVEVLNRNLERTVEERTKELVYANQMLAEVSNRDPLTHVFNRLYFENLMERLLLNPQQLAVCIFDLDFFKGINDTYGHAAGDEMLRRVTAVVQQEIEEEAVFARIGGEEFVLVYQDKTMEEVMKSIAGVHRAVEENSKLSKRYTTASFGVAPWCPGDTEKKLLQKADAALYHAKDTGRNRVVLYSDIVESAGKTDS